jgi:hypothetical protein
MSVLFNIYCIPKQPHTCAWSDIWGAFVAQGLVMGPYRAGSPLRELAGRPSLRSPENFTLVDQHDSAPEAYDSLQLALTRVERAPHALLAADALASAFRNNPEHFYAYPASLGLYRFQNGYELTVGEPVDFSDVADQFPELAQQPSLPKWKGTVTEFLWLHGKNAPLQEDFRGSPLHLAIQKFWPGVIVLADEWP